MPSMEERMAVVETQTAAGIDLLKEIRDDVKEIKSIDSKQNIRIASLEQSRATGRKVAGIFGVPILGTVLHTVFKAIGLY